MTAIEIIMAIFLAFCFACLIGMLLFAIIDACRPFMREITRKKKQKEALKEEIEGLEKYKKWLKEEEEEIIYRIGVMNRFWLLIRIEGIRQQQKAQKKKILKTTPYVKTIAKQRLKK